MFFCMDWIVALSSSSSEPCAGAVVSTATRSARLTMSFFLNFVVIMRRRPRDLFSGAKNVETKIQEWPLLPIEEPQLLGNLWFFSKQALLMKITALLASVSAALAAVSHAETTAENSPE